MKVNLISGRFFLIACGYIISALAVDFVKIIFGSFDNENNLYEYIGAAVIEID